MTNPNNNVHEINQNHRIYEIYPYGNSSFTEYDDDGTTEEIVVSDEKHTITETGEKLNKYIHQLKVGDIVEDDNDNDTSEEEWPII